jgi:hypothetical protein
MILCTLIFFSPAFHERVISNMQKFIGSFLSRGLLEPPSATTVKTPRSVYFILATFFFLQLVLPIRYVAYPGNLFWTEQGYRFSWRVMLMEKAGNVVFHVRDAKTNQHGDIMPSDFLTPVQEKMMSTQPDMILQFAHFLEQQLKNKGMQDPEVRAEVYVTLNGRGTRKFIDDTIDLTQVRESFRHKDWILSFNP